MNPSSNPVLAAAGVFGVLGVALGAFGAHALKTVLTDQALSWWQTGVQYHVVHAVALLVVAYAPGRNALAAWTFGLGITLFSGSLYAMALTGVTALGMITPVGGVAFLVGWAALIAAGLAKRSGKN
jgi:uncharacterized membrane protein YgdD (TMEM256/DUF423 family)